MATTQTIDATILASVHSDVVRRTSISRVLFSFLLSVAGIVAFASTFEFDDRSSALAMTLMVLGTALFCVGIFRLFRKSRRLVYLPTGSITRERSIFFDLKHRDALVELVNSGTFPADLHIKSESSGNIRMDVILSADKKFAALQLFQFVPYNYQPITAVHFLKNEDVQGVVAFLSSLSSIR